MKSFQFYTLLMSVSDKREILYFLQLYRDSNCQNTLTNKAEKILMKAFQQRINSH